MLAQEQLSHTALPWHNAGTYRFDEDLHAFVLTASWYEPLLASQPFPLQPGDLVNPAFMPTPPAGEPPVPPPGENKIQSGCTPILETIIVTASAPPARMRMGFTRFLIGGGGGVRSNVVRPYWPTIDFKYIDLELENFGCDASLADREMAALEGIRGGDTTGFAMAGLYLIQYSPGHRQWWSCDAAPGSNCGIRSRSACSSNPPTPSQG